MASPTTLLEQIIRLNNEGAALLETNTFQNIRAALNPFKRALAATEVLNGLPPVPHAASGSSLNISLGHLCEGTKIRVRTDANAGLYFYSHALSIKPNAIQGPQAVSMSVAIVLSNMALACYQLASYCSTKPKCPLMRQRTNVYFQTCLTMYGEVVKVGRASEEGQAMQSGALVLLALAAQNNISWIKLKLGALEESKQAHMELERMVTSQNTQTLPMEEQDIIQEFLLNTMVLSLTGYFSELAAGAA